MANDNLGRADTKSNAAGDGQSTLMVTQAAFRQREAAIRAITELREGQFDVNAACTRLFGALPQIQAMRPQIEETFRKFDLPTFDDLEGRLHAAHYCNALWLSKATQKVDVASLAAELDRSISALKETIDPLVLFGKVDRDQLKRLGEEGGYGGKVNDITLLLGILRRLDPQDLNRTLLSQSDLANIEASLLTFQGALGKRQVVPVEREEASLLRAQALTYMLQSFDLALKAAVYLYGETEGKRMVPSPYADRGNRKSNKTETETEASSPGVNTTGSGVTSGAAAPEDFVVNNPTGLPLTNPFADDDKK